MNVKTILQNLRSDLPGCRVAAYVDLDTSMVLAWDAASPPPQERLDALAADAAGLFTAIAPDLVPVLTAAPAGSGPAQAALALQDRGIIAVAVAGAGNEAVCCELAPTADIARALARADAAGARLADG